MRKQIDADAALPPQQTPDPKPVDSPPPLTVPPADPPVVMKFGPFTDGSTETLNAVDVSAAGMRQYVLMAASEHPGIRADGEAGLRRIAAEGLRTIVQKVSLAQAELQASEARSKRSSQNASGERLNARKFDRQRVLERIAQHRRAGKEEREANGLVVAEGLITQPQLSRLLNPKPKKN